MQNQENNNDRRNEQLFNIAVMAVGSWLIWFLSGPIAEEVGRNTYEIIYDKIWGTPNWFSWRMFERAFYYIPNRSHIGNWLYNYAEYAGPLIAAPFLYKLPDFIRARFKKRVNQLRQLANVISDEDTQTAALSAVVSQLRVATLEDEMPSGDVYTPAREGQSDHSEKETPLLTDHNLGIREQCLRYGAL